MAITPMIDYSQGNDFDLNLQTMDDLHKPALDGIGYQDLIQEQMVGETSVYENGAIISNMKHLSANKTVAWIDYMTNYNRTFGDFAAGEALDFMVLNRRNEKIILQGTELGTTKNGSTELTNMFEDLINSQANKLGGMLLKTLS